MPSQMAALGAIRAVVPANRELLCIMCTLIVDFLSVNYMGLQGKGLIINANILSITGQAVIALKQS